MFRDVEFLVVRLERSFPISACVLFFSGTGGLCSCSPRRRRPPPTPCPRSSLRLCCKVRFLKANSKSGYKDSKGLQIPTSNRGKSPGEGCFLFFPNGLAF